MPIFIQTKNVSYWCVDRFGEYRGYWIETQGALYWLKRPCSRRGFASLTVAFHGITDDDKNNIHKPLEIDFPSPSSQQDLHFQQEARLALLFNIIDVFTYCFCQASRPKDPAEMSLQNIYDWLKKELNNEEPFDWNLLHSESTFVHNHLMGLYGEHDELQGKFLQTLPDLEVLTEHWTKGDYLTSIQLSNERTQRLASKVNLLGRTPSHDIAGRKGLESRLEQIMSTFQVSWFLLCQPEANVIYSLCSYIISGAGVTE
jgi:hypothetical protein